MIQSELIEQLETINTHIDHVTQWKENNEYELVMGTMYIELFGTAKHKHDIEIQQKMIERLKQRAVKLTKQIQQGYGINTAKASATIADQQHEINRLKSLVTELNTPQL